MTQRFVACAYHGRVSDLVWLYTKNIFLTLVTLSIYNAWGRTNIRQYIAKNIYVQQQPLAYVGQPLPLLWGWLLSLLANISIDFCMAKLGMANNILFGFLVFVGIYNAMRYQYANLYYGHLNGNLRGSALAYAAYATFFTACNWGTLSLFAPYFDLKIRGYVVNRLSIGNTPMVYTPNARALVKVHVITWLLIIPILGMSRCWYRAAVANMAVKSTTLGNVQLKSIYTGKKLLALYASIAAVMLGYGVAVFLSYKLLPMLAIIMGIIFFPTLCAVVHQRFLMVFLNNIGVKGDLAALPAGEPQPPVKIAEMMYASGSVAIM